MGQGLFLLLCVLALFIGTRARNSKALSPKSIQTRKKFKRILSLLAVALNGAVLILFIPAIYREIRISIDTHFTVESYLSMAVLIVGIFTFIAIIKVLKRPQQSN